MVEGCGAEKEREVGEGVREGECCVRGDMGRIEGMGRGGVRGVRGRVYSERRIRGEGWKGEREVERVVGRGWRGVFNQMALHSLSSI